MLGNQAEMLSLTKTVMGWNKALEVSAKLPPDIIHE